MELAAYFLNWAIWLLYPWNANSAQCKVMILGRFWPLQPLRKCSWPVLAYPLTGVLVLVLVHTIPKYPLWLIWGRESFLTCSQSGKAASENSKSSREDLYQCTLPTRTRKSIVRSKCTSEWKDNISHKQPKHIGIRQIAEIQWHFKTSQVLSIWERPSGIYGIPVVHKNIWLPQCWRRDSYIFNVAVFTCVPC